jgi:hypothetical protein
MTTAISSNETLREQLLAELRGGTEGVRRWNARPFSQRQAVGPLRGVDLGELDLAGVCLDGLDLDGGWLRESNLAGASLAGARLEKAWCAGACFHGANLSAARLNGANLCRCDCRGVNFAAASLDRAILDGADLCGADLATASLLDASLAQVRHDAASRFPPSFVPRASMIWIGDGPVPLKLDLFVRKLEKLVDPRRLSRAVEMLKAERFQLYSAVDGAGLLGVVRSQTDAGVVYSCRLGARGRFGCCSQDLAACLGLRGALCKHLLVLIVGLARAGEIDADAVLAWVEASRTRTPSIEPESMSETLLRYHGARSGECDWRPTETIPEDYYAL